MQDVDHGHTQFQPSYTRTTRTTNRATRATQIRMRAARTRNIIVFSPGRRYDDPPLGDGGGRVVVTELLVGGESGDGADLAGGRIS